MIRNTEIDLHILLDELTDGEHIKATWRGARDRIKITAEGPVRVDDQSRSCFRTIRSASGTINTSLTSLEFTRDEGVTVTRDDEGELHALLDSLEDGDTVTAEWSDKSWTTTVTGAVRFSGDCCWVIGYFNPTLRWGDRMLNPALHSVTVRRPVAHRWERGGHE